MKKIRLLTITVSVSFLALLSCNSQNQSKKGVELKNNIDSVSYSIGINVGKSMANDFKGRGMDTVLNSEAIAQGLLDVLKENETILDPNMAYGLINNFMKEFQTSHENDAKLQAEKNLADGNAFLKENKTKEGVVELESGLQYKIIKEGNGPKPQLTDKITAHYHGTLIDGTVFDSSVDRGEPVQFPVNGVIKGWTEALQLMPVGS
ncbi:MAG: FKBP-type peptidyl-prolyl cis-trans isomerase, partial [Chlorobi bacterium]|nr:FKBP-type peptidyl-prolyl cis-trans isomerase [Chlorobiota bacterium]